MKKEEYVRNRITEMGYNVKGFADKIGMANSTLRSILSNMDGAAIANVFKICQGLGITTDELIAVEAGEYGTKKAPPQFDESDEENKEIIEKIKRLSPGNLSLLDDYLEYLLWREQKAEEIRRAKSRLLAPYKITQASIPLDRAAKYRAISGQLGRLSGCTHTLGLAVPDVFDVRELETAEGLGESATMGPNTIKELAKI